MSTTHDGPACQSLPLALAVRSRFAPAARARLLLIGLTVMLLLLVASAQAATYYVSTTGDDAAAGTQGAPWRSIEASVGKLHDGDVLMVGAGTYTEGNINPGVHATPITIQAETPRAAVIDAVGHSFGIGSSGSVRGIRLIGLKIIDSSAWGAGIGFYGTGDDVGIDNCEVTACGNSIFIKGGSALSIRNTYVHNNNNGIDLGIKGVSGIAGVLIEDCTIADNALAGQTGNTDGIIAEGMCTDLIIRRCTASGHGDAGFDIKPVNALLERCLAYGNSVEGFKLWYQGVRLINCMARNNGDTGVTIGGNASELWNCTIANNGRTGLRPQAPDNSTVLVRNCIIASNMNRQYDAVMFNDDYNLYYAAPGQPIWRMYLPTGNVNYTIEDARAGLIHLGPHTIYGDPQFVDSAGGNLKPGPLSPVIGAGLWASFLIEDLLGNQRQIGAPPDLGAITSGVVAHNNTPLAVGWHRLAVPLTPVSPAPAAVMSSLGVSGQDWVLYDIIGGRNYAYPDTRVRNFAPGRAYWVNILHSGTLEVAGTAPDPAQPFSIALPTGWSLFGNPFDEAVPWDDAHISVQYGTVTKTLSEAVAAGWLNAVIQGYANGANVPLGPSTPGDLQPWNGYQVYARKACSLKVQLGTPVSLAAAARQSGTLLVSSLAAARTNAGAQVTFTLSAAATVRAVVTNIGGRPIATMADGQTCPAGVNTLLWDGRSASGLAVPAGQYVVHVEASMGNGQRSQALTTLNVRR